MINALSASKKFVRTLKDLGLPVHSAYLYGSQVKGSATHQSDIDICIVSSHFGKDFIKEMVQLRQISRGIDDRIEPLPFGVADITDPYDPLATEIRRFGKLVV